MDSAFTVALIDIKQMKIRVHDPRKICAYYEDYDIILTTDTLTTKCTNCMYIDARLEQSLNIEQYYRFTSLQRSSVYRCFILINIHHG